ncbi:MAG: hypothetical protein HKN82_11195 [Akkermansiaceae bacterium]|nr:hypothetical protein [Akkermansiaceae bacterium]
MHYHLVGACFEHEPVIGQSPERIAAFTSILLNHLVEHGGTSPPAAWCVLPNHYHLLIRTGAIKALTRHLGLLHGRLSREWNLEDDQAGRKVWHRVSDRGNRSGDHYWVTMNYIHHNPVHHGYVDSWTDWPFTSAHGFLEEVGRERAARIWREFPVKNYGKGWDDQ